MMKEPYWALMHICIKEQTVAKIETNRHRVILCYGGLIEVVVLWPPCINFMVY
jgi:hypothetical protein